MSQTLKTHVSLDTPRFLESVAFYRAFFGIAPMKLKPGYAKFDVSEPALNLTLNEGPVAARGPLNHLGIQVGSPEAVRAAADRLRAAGLTTREESNTDCCYALQDKVWVKDPDGNAWEVFVVKVADTRPDVTLESARPSGGGCCQPAAKVG